jgi:hypothetical protein
VGGWGCNCPAKNEALRWVRKFGKGKVLTTNNHYVRLILHNDVQRITLAGKPQTARPSGRLGEAHPDYDAHVQPSGPSGDGQPTGSCVMSARSCSCCCMDSLLVTIKVSARTSLVDGVRLRGESPSPKLQHSEARPLTGRVIVCPKVCYSGERSQTVNSHEVATMINRLPFCDGHRVSGNCVKKPMTREGLLCRTHVTWSLK